MGFCAQFTALLWKNWTIKRRAWVSSLFEIVLPSIVMVGLILIKHFLPPEDIPGNLLLSEASLFDQTSAFDSLNQLLATYDGIIGLTPNSPEMQDIGEYLETYGIPLNRIRYFDTNSDLNSYTGKSAYGRDGNQIVMGAIIGTDLSGPDYQYSLRFNSSNPDSSKYYSSPATNLPSFSFYQRGYDEDWKLYDRRGFRLFQSIVDGYILEKEEAFAIPGGMTPTAFADHIKITQQPFPFLDYRKDEFTTFAGESLGLFLTLVFIWPLTRIVSALVEEKELKIKQGMRMMGLSPSALIWSWVATWGIVFALISLLICLVTFETLYPNSIIVFIFLFYFLFCCSIFSFGYLMSTIFDKSRTASTFSAIIFLVTFFVSFFVSGPGSSESAKTLACLIPQVCLSQGAGVAAELESSQIGINGTTLYTLVDNFSFSNALVMLFVDTILYFLIASYLDRVIPTEFGIQLPWYFLFLPSYWCGTPLDRKSSPCGFCLREEKPENAELTPLDYANCNEPESKMEAPLSNLTPLIQMRDLRKTFPSNVGDGEFVAVKGMSLDMNEGQIYVLLGENGAGKSTTINMLTGLYSPTDGVARVNGYDISTDLSKIYGQQGVCFQHDVLYPNLTVKEHLHLYAAIKGVPRRDREQMVNDMIDHVGLGRAGDNKAEALVSSLSGGQKRKTSLGIALINDSKIVFLDEPSSGMDVASVRHTWELILNSRQGRVIVITTHDMDEAENLGDVIGIMASGKLLCSGSSLFLKNQYGVGYSLTISKDSSVIAQEAQPKGANQQRPSTNTDPNLADTLGDGETAATQLTTLGKSNIVEGSTGPTTPSGQKIFDYMTKHYPFVELISDAGGEISFRLPFEAAGQFSALLTDLESKKSEFNITTYGISVTNLTEVFLSVISTETREVHHDKDEHAVLVKETMDDSWGQEDMGVYYKTLASTTIFWQHFRALIIKRFHNARRDRKQWFWQLLYPGIILLASMLAMRFAISTSFPKRVFSPQVYDQPNQFDYATSNDPTITSFYDLMTSQANTFGISPTPVVNPTDSSPFTDPAAFQQYLQDTYTARSFSDVRTGALLIEELENFPQPDAATPPSITGTVYFNTTAQDALPIYQNMISNLFLQSKNTDASITVTHYPFNLTSKEVTFTTATLAFSICIAFSFVPATFAGFIVKERTDNVKHLQMVTGVSNLAYWASSFVWDVLNFVFPFILLIILLLAFDIKPLLGIQTPITILACWLFVIASCPFVYSLSFLFESHNVAQNMTLLVNFLLSVILLILSVVFTIIPSTRDTNRYLRFVYRLFPAYCFGDVIALLMVRDGIYPDISSPWDPLISGWSLIFLVIDFILYSGLLMLLEHWSSNNTLEWLKGGCGDVSATDDDTFIDPNEDDDVRLEREKIAGGNCPSDQYPVVLHGLRKVFRPRVKSKNPFIAVNNVYFSVKRGECLGFLGANGAGKSTTMKILTGDLYPSAGSGSAFIGGFDILQEPYEVRQLIGYCPQFDAHLPLLTGREHLYLYARIKCIPADKIDGFVNYMLYKLGLTHLADKPSGTYSGGNRRKLSVGIALIGNPQVVFLDEPSTGVDPSSRRSIWRLISSTMKHRAVVLTTHSMEEAEALCQRITIITSGRLRALGSSQHLKDRHGKGYQIVIKCEEGKQEYVRKWFATTFPQDLITLEEYTVNLKYRIPKDHHKMSTVFDIMEKAKTVDKIGIDSYSVSDTSLDQIFIGFVQEDDRRRAENDGERV